MGQLQQRFPMLRSCSTRYGLPHSDLRGPAVAHALVALVGGSLRSMLRSATGIDELTGDELRLSVNDAGSPGILEPH